VGRRNKAEARSRSRYRFFWKSPSGISDIRGINWKKRKENDAE
jgi:hypothetical protein